jgi:hypothetical protein
MKVRYEYCETYHLVERSEYLHMQVQMRDSVADSHFRQLPDVAHTDLLLTHMHHNLVQGVRRAVVGGSRLRSQLEELVQVRQGIVVVLYLVEVGIG